MLALKAISFSRLLRPALFILVACFLAACNTATNLKIDKVTSRPAGSPPAKVLVMPMDVELSLLMASGMTEPKAEWTEKALGFMKNEVKSQLENENTELTFYERAESDPESTLVQLEKLYEATGYSILIHDMGVVKLPSRKAKTGDWTLGEDAVALANETGADYALFVFVRDSYSSGGRVALMAFAAIAGVGVTGGQQIGFASLVDLKNGDIVWFNRLLSGTGDLRKAEPAKASVKQLLKGFPKL